MLFFVLVRFEVLVPLVSHRLGSCLMCCVAVVYMLVLSLCCCFVLMMILCVGAARFTSLGKLLNVL